MKRNIIYLVFVLALILPKQVASQTQIHHTLHFVADSLSFNTISVDSMTFTRVSYANEYERICDTGSPELPVMYYSFIIPYDKVVNQITLSNKVSVNYTLNNPIYPVQEPQATCINCVEPDFCLPNRQVYSSSNVFPANHTVSINYGYFDGNCHILTLGICPFEYVPTTGQFNILTSFDLNIDLALNNTPKSIIPVKRLRHSQDLYNQILFNLVENKEQINSFYITPTFVDEIETTTTGLPAYEYVIITPQGYASAFDDFVTWKKQKGVDIGIVTIEDVLSNYEGDQLFSGYEIFDNAGKLRQYLYEAYTQGTIYALLAGDLPLMPIRYGWASDNSSNNDHIIPTDLYFADINGNWNVDRDTCYGEPTQDNPDYNSDIYIGRLFCSSEQEISNWITKMLIYEKNPGLGNASYLIKSFMTEADQCQRDNEAEQVASYLTMFNHTIWRESPSYNSNSPVFPKGSDVVEELNTNQYGLMSWFNHGGTGNGESGIATMTKGINTYPQWKLQAQERFPYYQAEPDVQNGLDNINNYGKPFVLYSVSCWVTPFDRTSSINNSGARNCGEAFTVDNTNEGIAFLGNSRNGWVTISKNLYVIFAQLISDCSENQIQPHIGILEYGSKSLYCSSWYQKYNCYSHNLIGDPECNLWTCVPENLSVSIVPQSAILNRNNCFQVTVNNLNYNKSAVVTLYKAGELYDRVEVIGNQQNYAIASFDHINPLTQGEITFTVTSFGCLPYQESINVHEDCEIIISGTETWQDDDVLNCDVIINDGAKLTINSAEILFSADTKIIVKPGGRLILDGCTLTSICSTELWQGIEVWGNKTTHQYAVNGSYGQGYVELKNGATIENAVCALNLWRPDYWSYTGGIVHATDAVFRNNHRSVHALYYKNHHPTNANETDYNAMFKRCQFIVNENYIGDEDHVFHKHVDLSHVKGFKFYACDFSVTASSNNISYWTSGIAGTEAGFLVDGICDSYQIPCSDYDQSTFTGFFTAINSVSDGMSRVPVITVRHSSFDKNDFGIYMRKLSNASILFCDFDVKRQDNWLCGAGIFSENTYNFSIEENEFKKDNTFNGNGIGIYIMDSNNKNAIRHNLFKNLYCGNLAIGKNIEGFGYEYLGLEYLCNTNIDNNIDFYVLKEPNVYSGVQTQQGSAMAATRNTFSENGYHFYNGGDFKIGYYYYDVAGFENEKPVYYNPEKFFPMPTDQTSGCPSHYSGTAVDTVVISPEKRQQLEQEYYEAYNTYHSLKTIYEQHVDGGSTQNELNDITSATPSDMWALRAQLLNHSPYLSSEVLKTSADHPNILPESILFEILMSNPDELKKDSLMNYLENKDNPLPQDKINMLRQIANGTTAKTVMQTQMAASKRDFSRAAGEIIRSLVNDTILDMTELRGWLANLEDINADRDIIATYMDEGDFTTALALADMLPSLYGLTGTNLVEHQAYKDLLMLYRDWYNDGRNAMQMNSTERAIVEHIADYGTGYPQIMAQALLAELDWESYAENPFACVTLTLPEGGQGRGSSFTSEDFCKAMGMDVNVKPNPANTWTVVDYMLPAKMAKATIRVNNALGVTVMTDELNGNQGQKVLDLRDLADGVYVYTISCGEYVQTGKLVIAK